MLVVWSHIKSMSTNLKGHLLLSSNQFRFPCCYTHRHTPLGSKFIICFLSLNVQTLLPIPTPKWWPGFPFHQENWSKKENFHNLPPAYLPTYPNRVFPSLLYHGHLFYCVYNLIDSSLKSWSCNSPLIWIFNIFSAQLFSSVWKHFISSNHKTPSFDLSSLPTLIPCLSSNWITTLWKSYLITLFTHFLLTTLQSRFTLST